MNVDRFKLIATASLTMALMTMIVPDQISTYASPTTEDDGYTYPDDASDEEKEEIDEQEQEAWEDAGRPGERDDDDDDESNDNDDDNDDDNTPAIADTPALAVQNTAVNETRWYNNCEGGGKQAGGFLHFDIFAYENCESHANGDKGYYDGFVEGCMGIDSINTQELCEAFIVGCLRATSIDSSETCRVAVETSSSAWKLVMTKPDGL
jgi:hypothetical protein